MKRIILLLVVAWLQVAHAIVPEPRRLAEMPAVSGAYELLPDGEVRTHDAAGAYYAQQTLEQMGHVPATPLIDAPRYPWRGLHVDVSRHFFTVADLRHLMDTMARLKLNRLHLHLTDGPGWRIEIKRYPRLTSEGAWRKKLGPGNWEWRDFDIGSQYPELYGGYYTQQEMRELVAYAAERHIVIVPEIDVPGHAYAALVAYPELSLLPPGVPIKECQVGRDVLAANHPRTVAFVKAVLDEIMALFPAGNPIHLGGDEVDVNLLSMETQRAFMQDLVDYVKQHGYQPITWDEAACNGVSGQWVMLWRPDAAEKVFAAGHPVILCPCSHFYFDYPQCRADWPHPGGGHIISTEMVFRYSVPQHPQVVGLQANLWSEHIATPQRLWYMAFPRALALAERAWGSSPRPYALFWRCAQEWMQKHAAPPAQK